MAKFMFYASTGYVGSKREEEVEIPDDELEGLTEKEQEKVVQEYYDEWVGNNVELSWWRVEE